MAAYPNFIPTLQPQQFQNDPRGAVQYLLNNGTMQQNAFNSFAQFCQSAGIKI